MESMACGTFSGNCLGKHQVGGDIGDLAAILPAARQSNHRIARLSEFVTRPARGCAVRVERGTHADRQIQIAGSVRQKMPWHGRDTALWAANFKRQVRLVGEPTHQGLDPQNPDRKPRESLRRQRGTLFHARNRRWTRQALLIASKVVSSKCRQEYTGSLPLARRLAPVPGLLAKSGKQLPGCHEAVLRSCSVRDGPAA